MQPNFWRDMGACFSLSRNNHGLGNIRKYYFLHSRVLSQKLMYRRSCFNNRVHNCLKFPETIFVFNAEDFYKLFLACQFPVFTKTPKKGGVRRTFLNGESPNRAENRQNKTICPEIFTLTPHCPQIFYICEQDFLVFHMGTPNFQTFHKTWKNRVQDRGP